MTSKKDDPKSQGQLKRLRELYFEKKLFPRRRPAKLKISPIQNNIPCYLLQRIPIEIRFAIYDTLADTEYRLKIVPPGLNKTSTRSAFNAPSVFGHSVLETFSRTCTQLRNELWEWFSKRPDLYYHPNIGIFNREKLWFEYPRESKIFEFRNTIPAEHQTGHNLWLNFDWKYSTSTQHLLYSAVLAEDRVWQSKNTWVEVNDDGTNKWGSGVSTAVDETAIWAIIND